MLEFASLTEQEYETLKLGVNLLNKGETQFIVHKAEDGNLRACQNICRHQGGTFAPDIEDSASCIVRCTRHDWKLDVSKMEYTNPPNVHKQSELVVRRERGNGVRFLLQDAISPWDVLQARKDLVSGELTVTYLTHACLEIKLGNFKIITDPWILGPAFLRGWWLKHEPPADIWDRLLSCDAVWFSHAHTDHLNPHTLAELAKRRIDVPIFVGELRTPVIRPEIYSLGFTNINIVPVGEWVPFGPEGRFMINDDDTLPDVDSWLLLEYKGHRICNFVDCSAPSRFHLPDKNVDLILTDFASGASGFPSCFESHLGEEKVKSVANSKRATVLRKLQQLAKKTKTKAYIPVVGYFVYLTP